MAYQSQNEIPMRWFGMTEGKMNPQPSPVHARKYIFTDRGDIQNTGFLEILFIVSGNGQIFVEGKDYSVKRGILVILDSGTLFQYIPDSPLIIYSCSFMPSLFERENKQDCCIHDLAGSIMLEGYFQNPAIPFPVCRIGQKYFEIYRDLFGKMISLTETVSPVTVYLMRLHLAEVLIRLAEIYWQEALDKTPGNADIVQNVISYIQKNYASHLTYDSLAQIALISRSKLFKLFTEETGQTISDYIKMVRIRQACVLLAETPKSIYNIMLEVGYNDMKMFCRYFKEYTQMTPSAYRNQYKKV